VERVKESYRDQTASVVAAARESERQSNEEAARLRAAIDARARITARMICRGLAALLGLVLVAGTALTVVKAANGEAFGPAALVALAVVAVVGLMGALWGFNVKGWRASLEERMTRWLRSWLTDDNAAATEPDRERRP
jgi:hypothetical protein